jgi:hypothetical protein
MRLISEAVNLSAAYRTSRGGKYCGDPPDWSIWKFGLCVATSMGMDVDCNQFVYIHGNAHGVA